MRLLGCKVPSWLTMGHVLDCKELCELKQSMFFSPCIIEENRKYSATAEVLNVACWFQCLWRELKLPVLGLVRCQDQEKNSSSCSRIACCRLTFRDRWDLKSLITLFTKIDVLIHASHRFWARLLEQDLQLWSNFNCTAALLCIRGANQLPFKKICHLVFLSKAVRVMCGQVAGLIRWMLPLLASF